MDIKEIKQDDIFIERRTNSFFILSIMEDKLECLGSIFQTKNSEEYILNLKESTYLNSDQLDMVSNYMRELK